MNMSSIVPLVLGGSSLVGFYSSYLYGRKTKAFKWREYFVLFSVPVVGSLSLAYFFGLGIIWLFLVSAVAGLILEYIIGLSYHKTLNHRLWTYHRLSIGGYTSLLTLPMWGILGVVFWLISKFVGL
jgi:hypothetical protein